MNSLVLTLLHCSKPAVAGDGCGRGCCRMRSVDGYRIVHGVDGDDGLDVTARGISTAPTTMAKLMCLLDASNSSSSHGGYEELHIGDGLTFADSANPRRYLKEWYLKEFAGSKKNIAKTVQLC
eukprot:2261457-Amphidinium_carterae.2